MPLNPNHPSIHSPGIHDELLKNIFNTTQKAIKIQQSKTTLVHLPLTTLSQEVGLFYNTAEPTWGLTYSKRHMYIG